MFLSNVTLHPWSHNWPMEIKLEDMFGKRCAFPASTGNVGIANVAVCVACIVLLSGRRTDMPDVVGILLVHGLMLDK